MSTLWLKFTRRLSATRDVLREADWTLLLEVILFASAVPLLMRLTPLRLERLFGSWRPLRGASHEAVGKVVRHFQLARRVGSPLVRSGCLTRGLTHYYFLRRTGLDVVLWFGMGRVAGELSGHCWLAVDGAPFLEKDDPRSVYAPIFSIPHDTSQPARTRLPAMHDLARS